MTDSHPTLRIGHQQLMEAAQHSCERSRRLVEQSRETLGRHCRAVADLRLSVVPGGANGPRPASGTGARRAVDLDEEVVVGPLRLVPLRRAVIGESARVLLTPSEWQLLVALVMHRSTTLTRSELATTAWGPGFARRHGEVEVYISRLRRKLARAGGPVHIRTVRGHGYRLFIGDEPQAEGSPAAELGGGAA